MYLSESFFSVLTKKGVLYEMTKHFVIFYNQDNKKSYFSGKRVQLLEFRSDYGPNFQEVSEEEARIRHLGRVRCLGTITSECNLLEAFSKYYNFQLDDTDKLSLKSSQQTIPNPQYFKPVIEKPKVVEKPVDVKEKKSKEVIIDRPINIKDESVLITDKKPGERDECQLVSMFRASQSQEEKDRIFKTIIFKRGVNGKTWDQIVTNYINYNKYKFSHFYDRNEKDFYQDIIMSLLRQIEKWFDVDRGVSFSTYAWYTINCAFYRILQSLSTQKRRFTQQRIDLNDDEKGYSDTVSIEKSPLCKMTIESELEQRDLCAVIKSMFALKEVKINEELKQELIDVINNKTTMQNSFYTIAKKFNIEIDKVFKLERILRTNMRNSLYIEIIKCMQFDVETEEQIAQKFNRSKGHVMKMKRRLKNVVISKLHGEYI